MSKDRIAGPLPNHKLLPPSVASPDPGYWHSVLGQSVATTHAICVVSSLREQAVLVVEKNRVQEPRLMNYSNGCKLQPPNELNRTDIASLLAFRTRAALKRDALIFGQALEAGSLNVLEVRKQVATAIVWSDKAKTLGIIEPFHCASLNTHVISFLKR